MKKILVLDDEKSIWKTFAVFLENDRVRDFNQLLPVIIMTGEPTVENQAILFKHKALIYLLKLIAKMY